MNLPNRSNTCFVIVTFNPDSGFTSNLLQHHKIADKIIIVDNNSECEIASFISTIKTNGIEIIRSNSNKGIAWALNKGIKRAISLSYEWVVTFDQDSFPNEDILSFYSQILKKEDNIGLIGTSFSETLTEVTKIHWKSTLTVITSGALHPIWIFDKVDFYNERLFIDNVDFDFSLRVSMAGYKVIRVDESLLKHRLGSPVKKYGLTSTNHNITRRYYYAKNNIYLTRTYFKSFPLWIIKKNYFFIKSIILLIIVEENVYTKLKSIIKGIRDEYKEL